MRVLITIASMCLVAGLFAQDSTGVRSKWRIGVSGAYGITFRQLTNNSDDPDMQLLMDLYENLDEPRNGYAAGIDVIHDAGEHWSFSSGIHLVDLGFRTMWVQWMAVDPIEQDPVIQKSGRLIYHYQYISLPLLARYRIGRGRFHLEPALGVSGDLLYDVHTISEERWPDGSEERERHEASDENLKKGLISAVGELNLHYRLGQRWELRFGPQARYQLTPMNDTPISCRLYQGSLALGCTFRL